MVEVNEELAKRLAALEHLLTRNSGNSGMRSSRDDEPGRTPPEKKDKPRSTRTRGKQPGAPGTNLGWSDTPGKQEDRFPGGTCECGTGLAEAVDLGVVDSFQQHEIPLVTVRVTQYDQHAVRCGCGKVHTAGRPEGSRPGRVGYGPNLQAWIVFLMVAHYVPAQRCCELLESLTGAKPSPGFVHGMLERTARALTEVDLRIRTLITLAYAVCADETPLRVGPKKPRPGRKKAEKYLLVACTELFTHYLLSRPLLVREYRHTGLRPTTQIAREHGLHMAETVESGGHRGQMRVRRSTEQHRPRPRVVPSAISHRAASQ